ncbi:MAG: ABC transporter ATP-binding protein [Pirellulaceae bacterium]|nr:ABC transporter ATP-binding protein [Pirellulaceae bacterium]
MICVQHLSKSYGTDVQALDDVSFSVPPGVTYGLLGPNGAGKTTTLRILMGLLSPTTGQASIAGCPVSAQILQTKSLIGLMSASAGLYQWLTPREVLRYFAVGYGLSAQQAAQRIELLAQMMEIQPFMDRRCATLSTGQAQRVQLARALVHDPPVVLLDEPTRGLDVVGAKTVFDYVLRLKQMNKAIIVSTHQLDEAERLCDRYGLLHRGRLKCEGTLAELQQQTGQATLVDMFLNFLSQDTADPSGLRNS